MKNRSNISRRNFMQMGASFGLLAALGRFQSTSAADVGDYKALVCVFMLGGSDGHNTIVPLANAQYNAYAAARGQLALPPNQLLSIGDAMQGAFGLHYGLPELQNIYQQGRMAVISNVGMLVRPTSYGDVQSNNQLPTNLRSHADQIQQMQTGHPSASGSSGWGGRTADLVQSANAGTSFPTSISLNGTALFCTANTAQSASLQPGNYLEQYAMDFWPSSAAQARATAQQQILAAGSSNQIIQAANKTMSDAWTLGPLLKAAANNPAFTTPFPQTELGRQLKEIARIISLRSQTGAGRQVFFASLGGFDTHGGQAYQHWALLQQVSQAMAALYNATAEMGIANKVTSFTLSDFGRTLQPSGSGSDHGWGNHHLVVGGAVNGGRIYGQFPLMTNYSAFNATHEDYADNRGVMLPQFSLSQYGATLAKWFGAADAQLDTLFPTLASFNARDLGFLP
ncbi:MAG TPA: DUF1501 domain-containing protein [Blastocatellia bacterium]|nr:DUF1501 domain-containing protein [Blastocatellia bacterium]